MRQKKQKTKQKQKRKQKQQQKQQTKKLYGATLITYVQYCLAKKIKAYVAFSLSQSESCMSQGFE